MELVIIKNDLPLNVSGFLVADKSCTFKIVINSSLSEDQQAAAFLHECLHIWNEDFFKKKTVLVSEDQTNQQLKRIAKLILEREDTKNDS